VWQQVYAEINDPNFIMIVAAQDTGGEAAAGPIFDAANPTYVQVVDEDHSISAAFNFVNVPSAAWIDESGRIVRIDEGSYAKLHTIGEGDAAISFGTDVYAPAVKDWAARGADSEYVRGADIVANSIRQQSSAEQQADAAFRLGNLFRNHGQAEKAESYWQMARELNPDSVNYFRQDLTLSEEGSAGITFQKKREEYIQTGKDYYRPLDIE
jgi:tetratricopeptide (TPR) repeat protein